MSKIPTAEELIQQYDTHIKDNHLTRVSAAARKLAQLHVEAALKAAHRDAKIVEDNDPQPFGGPFRWVDEKSILSAYPLENIQ